MTKIMFICHGNICRSPMGEFILKDLTMKRGLSDRFYIASCATSTEEIGNPVYPPAREKLAQHGISCQRKRAVQLKRSDYSEYDLFLCMDRYNLRNALRIFGEDPNKKVRMLMDYAGRDADVDDPWYSGNFDQAFDDIKEGCLGLLEALIQ
ncbi:MAG: low molecular weight phosphotyrosine protein phosphatase [Clostridia bacterium]|nr:low molecular weight phosphotyrosine protein phosphatase [Clostridia bacterium]